MSQNCHKTKWKVAVAFFLWSCALFYFFIFLVKNSNIYVTKNGTNWLWQGRSHMKKKKNCVHHVHSCFFFDYHWMPLFFIFPAHIIFFCSSGITKKEGKMATMDDWFFFLVDPEKKIGATYCVVVLLVYFSGYRFVKQRVQEAGGGNGNKQKNVGGKKAAIFCCCMAHLRNIFCLKCLMSENNVKKWSFTCLWCSYVCVCVSVYIKW